MAQSFRSFLENASELYKSLLDESLLIVSIIGKDSKTWKKSDIVNNLCGTQACIGQIDSENPEIFIEAYLSTEDSTLFFVLHGVHDFDLQTKLFASDEYKNKSFFEKLAKAEYDELSLLHLLFLLSHLVVVVEQGRYFDTTYMKTFADVNQMRLSAKDHLVDELLHNPQLPKMWSDYGRLSCPRICFLFPDRCIRHELPYSKKKEIAEKLEVGWEAQIFNNLKHIRIVDTSLINCLIVLPEDVRYVHVAKSPSEEPRDLIVDLLSRFLDNSNSSKDDEDIREPDYCTFLRSAMQNILRYGDRFKNFNCFPTLKEFIIGAQITYNTLIEDVTVIKLEEFVPELAIAQSIETSHWERAIHNYRTNCISNGGCFSKAEHLNELEKATDSVKAMVDTGESLREALIKVTETCTEYWENGHQRCESVSVTGHYCKHKIHENDVEHDSGYRFTSSCNCGKKQITRMDPFNLKDANYDFFLQFPCCSNMDSFKFQLFSPSSPVEPTGNVSPDDSERLESPVVNRPNLHRRAKSTASESSKITDTAALSGETIDDEELEDEEVDTVFDRYLDDDKLKELFLDEKDKNKVQRQGTSLMEDEELNDEEEDSDEDEGEEDEEDVEGIGSYLDNYDDNLKLDKPKVLSYDKLLKHYKGQFIEYLPHSNAPPGLLPGFPSWSLKAIGPSNRYSHQHGLRLPNFKHGCDFLLPLDVYLRVNSKDWENDLKKLNPRLDLSARSRRKPLGLDEEEGMNTEKVKV
uniref:Nonsense-mediated mRNA decay factor SMG8 n=1 Tax=Panagrolaimus superbus TaxID=310955 RepID=A0A914Y230_9BILA